MKRLLIGIVLLFAAVAYAQRDIPQKTPSAEYSEGFRDFYVRVNGVAGGVTNSITIPFSPSMRGNVTMFFNINGKKSPAQLASTPDTITMYYAPYLEPMGTSKVYTGNANKQTLYPFNLPITVLGDSTITYLYDGFGTSAAIWRNRSFISGSKIGTNLIIPIRADSIPSTTSSVRTFSSNLNVGGMYQSDGITLYITANDTIQVFGRLRFQ